MSDVLKMNKMGLLPDYFPTVMQAFIFRNWNMVLKDKIAEILETSIENVEKEAKRMGLPQNQIGLDDWAEKGYITIIRANWHLISYQQLLQILEWSSEKLAMVLKEEDFLYYKLGEFKPNCKNVKYKELTDAEIAETEYIRKTLEGLSDLEIKRLPFDFWSKDVQAVSATPAQKGQAILDNTWMICDRTADGIVKTMYTRFAGHMKDMWNIDLLSEGHYPITLSYVKGQKEEYHKIIIKKDSIKIIAGGSAGILRALYRLEDLATAGGGPHFDCKTAEREPRFDIRFIYPFCALYEAAFDVDSRTYCPDEVLEKYAQTGVNGIWLQAVLYRMTEFPFAAEFSKGWEKRQENLRRFVNRAKKYGIKIYLYLNEPRTMPSSFFYSYPNLKGATAGDYSCLCLSKTEVQQYLSCSVESLCRAVPGLGGFFTITMSENLTHCKSREVDQTCPWCKDTPAWELAATVNRLIYEGARRADETVTVIAWDWSWEEPYGFVKGDTDNCINALPEGMAVMCKRESKLPFVRGGVEGQVIDYAISVDGVSEQSIHNWNLAKKRGCKTAVKLQINNSWECSTVPYLPVFDTFIKQMESILKLGINHLMLSWTLGGYPSPNIKLVSEAFFLENGKINPDYENGLKMLYGDRADKVREATNIFSEAFREFPFDVGVLYNGPQNAGVSNPLYRTPTGYTATMTCFSYDDIESWRSIYPADILEDQFKKVSEQWRNGLNILDENMGELYDIAYVSYSLFRSSYNQIKFIRLRDKYLHSGFKEIADELAAVVSEEKEIAVKVYEIMLRRPEIGFEAANHYYYSTQTVLEKIVNCEFLIRYYKAC